MIPFKSGAQFPIVPRRKGNKFMLEKCLRFVLRKEVSYHRGASLGNLREELYFKGIMSVMTTQMLPYFQS
jgi:hypothetical protein